MGTPVYGIELCRLAISTSIRPSLAYLAKRNRVGTRAQGHRGARAVCGGMPRTPTLSPHSRSGARRGAPKRGQRLLLERGAVALAADLLLVPIAGPVRLARAFGNPNRRR